jgi:hypothetical protein
MNTWTSTPGKRRNRPCEVLLHISGNATNQAVEPMWEIASD